MFTDRKEVNLEIGPQNYFKNLLDNFEYREKGRVRQRLILWFLMQFKYATQKQLGKLINDQHRNIGKILRKLEERQYIKTSKYFSLKIISITPRGLEEIAEELAEDLASKENYNKQLGFLEHQLYLRSLAISHHSNDQIIINGNIYRKLIYKFVKENYGEGYTKKLFKDYHRADLTLIKNYNDTNIVLGIEFENSLKKRDKVQDKLKSMLKSAEILYQGYFFQSRKKYLLKNFTKKAYSLRNSNDIIALLTTTNLYSIKEEGKINKIPMVFEKLEIENLIDDVKNIIRLENYL